MSAPKTLGQRIQRWGMWAISPLDNTEPVESSGTIAAYADACERLAKAADAERAALDALNAALACMYEAEDDGGIGKGAQPITESDAYEAACNEQDAALAAYRELVTASGAA